MWGKNMKEEGDGKREETIDYVQESEVTKSIHTHDKKMTEILSLSDMSKSGSADTFN
jgi:hypothetical protein